MFWNQTSKFVEENRQRKWIQIESCGVNDNYAKILDSKRLKLKVILIKLIILIFLNSTIQIMTENWHIGHKYLEN